MEFIGFVGYFEFLEFVEFIADNGQQAIVRRF